MAYTSDRQGLGGPQGTVTYRTDLVSLPRVVVEMQTHLA